MSAALDVVLEAGDITTTRADVVLLKHAQSFYGADNAVALRLEAVGVSMSQLKVPVGDQLFVETRGCIGAPLALFLGTVRLGHFGYHEIRQFSARALKALESREGIRHIACTERIKERIDSAKVVIADLSMANPNVYLEVGYAWGRGQRTILLVRDVKELRFDVASYRCLVYKSIRDLENQLTRELQRLGA